MNERGYYYSTGRRKSAVARVRLCPGQGPIVVNGRPFEEFFALEGLRRAILEPLIVTSNLDRFNATIKVSGGGNSGQAGAIRHGIARALVVADESLKPVLRGYGLLTRDPRVKERKKYGLVRARKAKQYTKR
ncbi:MAG: 30S ribosomal protein S9 [Dehalococcoidia bacterium]|nr:30S ribosomal protein S9 [Chloroflexota bacterium]MCK4242373.1 30S ribosomal protein S9 [Dehalococcoidia bacterium]